jgi:hypothetical protein
MIPPRYLGLGAAIFLVGCGPTPPPVVNVTVVMPAQRTMGAFMGRTQPRPPGKRQPLRATT